MNVSNRMRHAMTTPSLAAAEASLSNDEASSDAEVLEHFVVVLKLTSGQAENLIAKRTEYLNP